MALSLFIAHFFLLQMFFAIFENHIYFLIFLFLFKIKNPIFLFYCYICLQKSLKKNQKSSQKDIKENLLHYFVKRVILQTFFLFFLYKKCPKILSKQQGNTTKNIRENILANDVEILKKKKTKNFNMLGNDIGLFLK